MVKLLFFLSVLFAMITALLAIWSVKRDDDISRSIREFNKRRLSEKAKKDR